MWSKLCWGSWWRERSRHRCGACSPVMRSLTTPFGSKTRVTLYRSPFDSYDEQHNKYLHWNLWLRPVVYGQLTMLLEVEMRRAQFVLRTPFFYFCCVQKWPSGSPINISSTVPLDICLLGPCTDPRAWASQRCFSEIETEVIFHVWRKRRMPDTNHLTWQAVYEHRAVILTPFPLPLGSSFLFFFHVVLTPLRIKNAEITCLQYRKYKRCITEPSRDIISLKSRN